ncbi:hypothetical protein NON20_14000 [Synechocystis sp. B12]|nr:hypothetical protein NON20_14000 [Synechocystis sp. B12]
MTLNYDKFLSQLKGDDIINNQGKLFEFKFVKTVFNGAFLQDVSYAFHQYCKGKKVDFIIEKESDWFEKGVECKILQAGSSGWKKGKIKINVCVEFIPDEPEPNEYQSPLDEIRQEIQSDLQ